MDAVEYATVEEYEAAFQRRLDLARLVLERRYRWARRTLRGLEPVPMPTGTMACDKYRRLYYGPAAMNFSDQEFIGAVWHEVNHILRHHHDRLSDMGRTDVGKMQTPGQWANVAADLEINDDFADQGIELPEGVCYSEKFGHTPHRDAESHFYEFVDNYVEPEPQESQDGEGEPAGLDSDQPNCGSGAGNDPIEGEQGESAPEDQAKQARDERRQDEEIVEHGPGRGVSEDIYAAAVERLGKSEHDWRKTFAAEVRTAMEQRADEAEEYTFRRRSRRQAGFEDDFILPGSVRPVPKLGVEVDVSGSMDEQKLVAAMREVHGILERLAIPDFTVYACNTRVVSETVVSTYSDIAKVFEFTGGGTDMMNGMHKAVADGCEVVIILTDADSPWDQLGPFGVPVIVGGINRTRQPPVWARTVDVEGDGPA